MAKAKGPELGQHASRRHDRQRHMATLDDDTAYPCPLVRLNTDGARSAGKSLSLNHIHADHARPETSRNFGLGGKARGQNQVEPIRFLSAVAASLSITPFQRPWHAAHRVHKPRPFIRLMVSRM